MLIPPSSDAPYCLMVDASNVAIDGVLQQQIKGTWQPISFFSKKLQLAEIKCSTFARELLAIYLSIRHFRHFLEGHEFYVLTDHKPLTHALSSSPFRYSPMETRHLDYISQFTSEIRHIHGRENPIADTLSSIESNALTCPSKIDFTLQQRDPDIQALKSSSSLRLQEIPLPFSTGSILCDMSTASPRPYVPPSYHRQIFDQLHCLSHPGIRATQRLVTERFVWPSINKDVRQRARYCPKCQTVKVHRLVITSRGTFLTPYSRFDHLHVVIIGPLPPSQGF